MIEVTKLNGSKMYINADLIEMVEETPDTVVTLTTGKRMVVKEGQEEIRKLIIAYKREFWEPNYK